MQSKDTSAPERGRSRRAVACDHESRDDQTTRGIMAGARVIAIARRGIAISLETIDR